MSLELESNLIELLLCSEVFTFMVIIGAPKADTSQYQQGVSQGGAVYRCDISDDNRCQIIHFDSNGELKELIFEKYN
ncbi:CLUMA_CG014987, isoform A [Clunio marinus]|uniref:CLUMA_CG014987, isoform A n=1 Tax=Clunio marinus TaxID=568069 RepID=A0A1J1INH2_9DIPT|nr:CLUMA_CG014987, isoform A [Clunio marinus]